jgi:hypothetical protein
LFAYKAATDSLLKTSSRVVAGKSLAQQGSQTEHSYLVKKKYVQTETYGVLMPDVIISFTTIEFPDQSVMEKAASFGEKYGELFADVKVESYRGQVASDFT